MVGPEPVVAVCSPTLANGVPCMVDEACSSGFCSANQFSMGKYAVRASSTQGAKLTRIVEQALHVAEMVIYCMETVLRLTARPMVAAVTAIWNARAIFVLETTTTSAEPAGVENLELLACTTMTVCLVLALWSWSSWRNVCR